MDTFLQQLHALLQLPVPALTNNTGKIESDSRQIQPGDIFFALQGYPGHGAKYIEQAIASGAIAVYSSRMVEQLSVPIFYIPDLEQYWPDIINLYTDNPSEKCFITATTGTNGKSSIAYYLTQATELLGEQGVYIGTLGKGQIRNLAPTPNTSLDLLSMQRFIQGAHDQGIQSVHCEASSHALDQGRLAGVRIDLAIYTHLSRDHLDYHKTMDKYAQAKAQLFATPGLRYALIQAQEAYSDVMREALSEEAQCFTYSCRHTSADFYAEIQNRNPYHLLVRTPFGKAACTLPVLADFECENLLAVLGALCLKGHAFERVIEILPQLGPVPGRMERYPLANGAEVVIDYAHTPDALEQALKALRSHASHLHVLFGCGGDRDTGKRALMGAVADKYADSIVLTEDNSRTEPVAQILTGIVQGINNHTKLHIEPDRAKAVRWVCQAARAGDTILLAGKGHETYIETDGRRAYFDEREYLSAQ